MNILVIGSGGREHAIIWAISKSPLAEKIFAAPGNAGINKIAESANIDTTNHNNVIEFCKTQNIDFVIIGPEAPLVDGLVDSLDTAGIKSFGTNKAASQLEGSKDFTKKICDKYDIPTAKYESFTDANQAKNYIEGKDFPIVIKADGLAAGKGVIIAQDKQEAIEAIDNILTNKNFGDAGNLIVIEEFLQGEELSFFALVDGTSAIEFGSAQDHKAVGEGDTGPNTGGMGTYSPAPIADSNLSSQIMSDIIQPLIDGMKQEGCSYKGIVFAGLMITKDGPKLLEINVRFGDPETQVLMARLESDLLELLVAVSEENLKDKQIKLTNKSALCVVMATQGYPGSYEKGSKISNLAQAEDSDDIIIFHAGTKLDEENNYIAAGGRVLGVTALGGNITDAQNKAYDATNKINWPEGFCRKDIGYRAVAREKEKLAS